MRIKYFLLLIALVFFGCTSNDDTTVTEQRAIIKDGANVSGHESCGWVIQFNNGFNSVVVPESIPTEFQQDNLEVLVILTNSAVAASCTSASNHQVSIVSIRLAN
ncbi:hypothetical protein BFP97_14340 [Roseivirga sp. 4D4]|uniref:hypothetical protein n=1 Tax=Roseivirga sp. 4D4 TaxID=1889784 RepID=UPI000852CDA9|nr:hypothetical protein [Roseivirga sp. 4D4]OEK02629.1 hypothetical protein BFP97_14340 [Roseivirga sp. 4D4]